VLAPPRKAAAWGVIPGARCGCLPRLPLLAKVIPSPISPPQPAGPRSRRRALRRARGRARPRAASRRASGTGRHMAPHGGDGVPSERAAGSARVRAAVPHNTAPPACSGLHVRCARIPVRTAFHRSESRSSPRCRDPSDNIVGGMCCNEKYWLNSDFSVSPATESVLVNAPPSSHRPAA